VAALHELAWRAAFLIRPSRRARRAIERRLRGGELDLVYIAPERLITDRAQRLLGDLRVATGSRVRHRRGALRFHNGATTSGRNTASFRFCANALRPCRASL